jgi:hypothetical protein
MTMHKGFTALISAIIISVILLGLAVALGGSTFFARFNSLNREYKRISLGLAEACVHEALGRIAADFDYVVPPGGEVVDLGEEVYGRDATCTIIGPTSIPTETGGKKEFLIETKASYAGAFSSLSVSASAQDPEESPVKPLATCTLTATPLSVPLGQPVTLQWSLSANAEDGWFSIEPGIRTHVAVSTLTGQMQITPTGGTGERTYVGTVFNEDDVPNNCVNDAVITVTPPPPAPACADTVMMLDRTGSMSDDLGNERNAANALVSLYSGALGSPKIGIGSFGAYPNASLPGGAASVPTSGQLTSSYAALTTLIGQMTGNTSSVGSNLGRAIEVGENELDSVRHDPNKEQVLIFVSDGIPNEPSVIQNSTGTSSPTTDAQNASGDLWTNASGAYGDAGGAASDGGTHRHRFYNFNLPAIPSGSTIAGIFVVADAWSTTTQSSVRTTLAPSGIGAYDHWTANTGSRTSAVSTNDGDSSYIDTASWTETFDFANAGIPGNAVVNSVTLQTLARATASGASLWLAAENGGAPNLGSANALTTSYQTFSRAMTTNPLTGNPWTASEVNGWTTSFGVRGTAGSAAPRVTQTSVVVTYTPFVSTDSGLRTPSATHTPNNWDINTVANVQTSNNTYASDNDNDDQGYASFGFSLPSNALVTGIQVLAEAKSSDPSGCELETALSWNGSSFTGNRAVGISGSDTLYAFGGTGDTWGRTWTPAELNSTNFTVRVAGNDPGSNCTNNSLTSLDQLQVRIYYDAPGTAQNVTVNPVAVAGYNQWNSTTVNKVSAVSSNDSDSSYIHGATNVETFSFPGSGVPTGATIQSVAVSAVARSTTSGGTFSFVAENSGTLASIGSANTLTTNYQTFTATTTTNPLTGNPWTLAEVNTWSTRFGVSAPSGTAIPRVTQYSVAVTYAIAPSSSGCQLGMDLSWNGGSTWTSEKTVTLTGTEASYLFGSPTDDWNGHTWSVGDFTNGNFRARVRDIDPGTSCADVAVTNLDWLRLQVFYNQPGNPTQYARDAASGAETDGTDIFAIHFDSAGGTSGQALMEELASASRIAPSSITSATRSGGTATITTSGPHRLTQNQRVRISGVSTSAYNGAFTVTSVPSSNVFRFTLSGSGNGSGGTASPTNLFLAPSSSAMSGIFQSIGYQVCPAAAAACSNTVDDDGDGLIDSADGGCHDDGDETNPSSYDPDGGDEWVQPAILPAPPPPPPPPNIAIGAWVEN